MAPHIVLITAALVTGSSLFGVLLGFRKGWENGYAAGRLNEHYTAGYLPRTVHELALRKLSVPTILLESGEMAPPIREM